MSKLEPSSQTMPSICMNSGRCVESIASFLNTLPIENTLKGSSGSAAILRMVFTVVCVRSRVFLASSRLHLYCHPSEPVFQPFS
jgi:hypothetical protein